MEEEISSNQFGRTPMAVIVWDMEFRVTRWNPAASAIFGYSADEAIGQHASFIVPEDYRSHVDQVWEALLDRAGGERSTNENLTKDGRLIECEWYNTVLVDERGKVTGVASHVTHFAEQQLARRMLAWEKGALELISSSASLQEILDGLANGLEEQVPDSMCSILLLDEDGIHLRHGAAPSLPDSYNSLIDGIAISRISVRAELPPMMTARSSSRTSPAIRCGRTTANSRRSTACAPAGRPRSTMGAGRSWAPSRSTAASHASRPPWSWS